MRNFVSLRVISCIDNHEITHYANYFMLDCEVEIDNKLKVLSVCYDVLKEYSDTMSDKKYFTYSCDDLYSAFIYLESLQMNAIHYIVDDDKAYITITI